MPVSGLVGVTTCVLGYSAVITCRMVTLHTVGTKVASLGGTKHGCCTKLGPFKPFDHVLMLKYGVRHSKLCETECAAGLMQAAHHSYAARCAGYSQKSPGSATCSCDREACQGRQTTALGQPAKQRKKHMQWVAIQMRVDSRCLFCRATVTYLGFSVAMRQ
jgi:hypothetical protein